ncbi:MAG: PaaI family thioesterase [Bacteroidota bacterium]
MEQTKQDFIEWWNQSPFFKWADLEIMEAADGKSELKLNVQRHHRGGGGTKAVHGGIIAYMFDGLLSSAARSLAGEDLMAMATMTLNVQYLQLLNVSEVVIGKAHVQKAGKSTAYVYGELYDDKGEACSTCTGIFRYFYKKSGNKEPSKL